ncbi:AfsR/SARP family transcriptional regulator [Streptomyces cylindrosporus]|uniref:Winged helix-turn-helix domain-containing protein n=1 Tax=Streptomyces cylindrosporus TaxID=2927583 RepID=A0ABS9Y2H5_9ACTN|nr:BTAD domain-containing putative transcriptional regulator [Streptomyces cylindrosporus]MCI3270166.1 winged helix-turn-helix domain-containing protein [Streptomyces cylindrosporus]
MDPVRYRILGSAQALRPDGTPVPVGGARLRALLTVLALRAGRAVPTGVLVEEVWDGDPPADAAGALQALVGRLRRALGADAIASAEGGYRLAAAPDDVDLHRFERLTGEGVRALADGDPGKAAGVLDDALALWRGPALADLPDRTAESARWDARRLDALRARHTAALSLGHAEQSLPELTALCDTHPLDEPLQALRLRALRAAGRPAEALAAYEEVRHLLAERLGVDPGPELRSLHGELLRPQEWEGRTGHGTGTNRGAGADGGAGADRGAGAGAHREARGTGSGTAVGPAGAAGRGASGTTSGRGGGEGYGSVGAGGRGSGEVYGPVGSGVRGGAEGDGPVGSGAGGGGEAYGPAGSGARGAADAYGSEGSGARGGDAYGSAGSGSRGAADAYGSAGTRARGDAHREAGHGAGSPAAPAPGTPTPAPGTATPTRTTSEAASFAPATSEASPVAPAASEAGPLARAASEASPFAPADPEAARPAPTASEASPSTPTAPQADRFTPAPSESATPTPLTPDPTPTPQTPGNLRARLTSFVGREADIDAIRGDLGAARLVTLLGPGGAGKTRLSQEAAETVRYAARDGVWLAELAPVDDPDAVPEAVLTAVGARETVLYGAGAEAMRAGGERHDDPVDRLAEHCGRRRMLIVLDNCEHVVDAAARLVEELLERCPELTVLATSREPLGVPGELLRPVEPLPEPVALRLLADRGAAARPGFRVEDDPEACAEICRRLDGLPLAIELAAARLRMLTPRQIADRLDDRFRLLTSGSRTVLPRQQTLRAVVDWSWDLLDAEERDVLCRLSVFAGGCDLAAAEAVCGPFALDAIGSLVDKSLVVAAPSDNGDMRYRLLETVAEYAGERLTETGRRAETQRAHLTYYRELARTTDALLRGPGQLAAIALLEREYENLRTALRFAVTERDEQEAVCLVLSLSWYWQMRDARIEARNWCVEVMALGPDPFTAPVRRANPVWQRCTDVPPPLTGELLEEARRGVHLAHLACMDTELEAWESPAAKEKLRLITEVYEPGLPQTCRTPGMLWFYAVMLSGMVDRLPGILDACVDTCRSTPGMDWELAAVLQMRANLLANRSDWAGDASRDADESLAIYQRIGDLWGTAEALSARGEAHERIGDYRSAAADYESAIGHAERLGARAQVAVLKARLGSALMEAGETERGERVLREVLESRDVSGTEALPAARMFLAARLTMSDRIPEAREQLRLLREQFEIAHFVIFDAFILGSEAWVELVDGEYELGLDLVRQALQRGSDPLAETMAPHMRPLYLAMAAIGLAEADGAARARDGARCLGAARAKLPAGHVATSMENEVYRRAERHARAALGDEAFEAAYAEGGGLSVKEATALV